jgi:hypothetical protein
MELDDYWIIQCPHPHCHNIQISRAKIGQATCTKCSKPFRVQLKKHFNRVLASATSLPEAIEKRTKLLEEQSKVKEPPFKVGEEQIKEEQAFYLCEECKNDCEKKYGTFSKVTLLPNMRACAFCKQIKTVYEIGKAQSLPLTPEPQNESIELSDDEKAQGITLDEKGTKRDREGVVIED